MGNGGANNKGKMLLQNASSGCLVRNQTPKVVYVVARDDSLLAPRHGAGYFRLKKRIDNAHHTRGWHLILFLTLAAFQHLDLARRWLLDNSSRRPNVALNLTR